MYRQSAAASCPACQGTLDNLHASIGVAGCSTCGGVWLGPETTMHVLQGLGDEVETEAAALSLDNARRSLHPAGPDSGARGCPMCGLVLMRVPVGQIVVDSCPAHGTFFDRDEVANVVSACHRLRADQDLNAHRQRDGATPVTASQVVEATETVVRATIGVLEIFLHGWRNPMRPGRH